MSSKQKAHCVIDLQDVVAAGSVQKAIEQWAKDSDDTCSSVVGMEFSTSGPGSGWSRTHDSDDFASQAFRGGALYYLDSSDGRLKGVEGAEEGDLGAECDAGGCWYTEGEWSEHSQVRLEVPEIEDAIHRTKEVAAMVQAVIDHHSYLSNTGGWRRLVEQIREAAEALDGIDADDL